MPNESFYMYSALAKKGGKANQNFGFSLFRASTMHSANSAASRKYPEASAPPNLSPLEILGRTTPAAYFICFCATYTPQCERVRVTCVHIDLWVRMISTSYQQTRKKNWSPTEF